MERGFDCTMHWWRARAQPPRADAEGQGANAPWVEVWESPQTIVMPGWVTPSSARSRGRFPDARSRASRPGCRTQRSCARAFRPARGELILDPSGTGVPSVGCCGRRRQRAVGPAHRAARQAQTVEGLRTGDLVHQVQVDVEQAGLHLVRLPDLLEHALGIVISLRSGLAVLILMRTPSGSGCVRGWAPSSCASVPRRRRRGTRPRTRRVLEVVGRSASKVTQSPSLSS